MFTEIVICVLIALRFDFAKSAPRADNYNNWNDYPYRSDNNYGNRYPYNTDVVDPPTTTTTTKPLYPTLHPRQHPSAPEIENLGQRTIPINPFELQPPYNPNAPYNPNSPYNNRPNSPYNRNGPYNPNTVNTNDYNNQPGTSNTTHYNRNDFNHQSNDPHQPTLPTAGHFGTTPRNFNTRPPISGGQQPYHPNAPQYNQSRQVLPLTPRTVPTNRPTPRTEPYNPNNNYYRNNDRNYDNHPYNQHNGNYGGAYNGSLSGTYGGNASHQIPQSPPHPVHPYTGQNDRYHNNNNYNNNNNNNNYNYNGNNQQRYNQHSPYDRNSNTNQNQDDLYNRGVQQSQIQTQPDLDPNGVALAPFSNRVSDSLFNFDNLHRRAGPSRGYGDSQPMPQVPLAPL